MKESFLPVLSKDRALEELYSNAYVYTLPSDLEGMPLEPCWKR